METDGFFLYLFFRVEARDHLHRRPCVYIHIPYTYAYYMLLYYIVAVIEHRIVIVEVSRGRRRGYPLVDVHHFTEAPIIAVIIIVDVAVTI